MTYVTEISRADPRRASSGLRDFGRPVVRIVVRIAVRRAAHFWTCLEVARQRQQLRELDDRALKDIGISRAEANREALRGFWDLPDHLTPRC